MLTRDLTLTARKAKEITQQHFSDLEQLYDTLVRIEGAAKAGSYWVVSTYPLSSYCKTQLENRGFKLGPGGIWGEYNTFIEWSNAT